MSLINSQVTMGEPLLADPLPFQDPSYRRMGQIENLGQVSIPASVKIEEVGGLLGGTGLLVGAAFVKSPAAIIMGVLGALGVAISGFSILSRMMAAPTPAAGQPGVPAPIPGYAPPPPPPPVKPTRPTLTQQIQTYMPVAEALLPAIQNLFSSGPKPVTPSTIITSYT